MKLIIVLMTLFLGMSSFAGDGDGDGEGGETGNTGFGSEAATSAAADAAEAAVSDFAGLPDVANFANLANEANHGMIGPDTLAQAFESLQNNPTVMSAAETMLSSLESLVANVSMMTGLSPAELQHAIDGMPDDDDELVAFESLVDAGALRPPHSAEILIGMADLAQTNGSAEAAVQGMMNRYCASHWGPKCTNWYSTSNPYGPNWSAGGP